MWKTFYEFLKIKIMIISFLYCRIGNKTYLPVFLTSQIVMNRMGNWFHQISFDYNHLLHLIDANGTIEAVILQVVVLVVIWGIMKVVSMMVAYMGGDNYCNIMYIIYIQLNPALTNPPGTEIRL